MASVALNVLALLIDYHIWAASYYIRKNTAFHSCLRTTRIVTLSTYGISELQDCCQAAIGFLSIKRALRCLHSSRHRYRAGWTLSAAGTSVR